MPNKQITDLDPLVGGMDDTYNFWTQKDGGGAGSSFQMAWSQLFIGNDVVGTAGDFTLQAGNGTGGAGYGGRLLLYSGDGEYRAGETRLISGDGEYGGPVTIHGGGGSNTGGNVVIRGGPGNGATSYGGDVTIYTGDGANAYDYATLKLGINPGGRFEIRNLPTSDPGGANRVWRDAGVLKIT